MADLSTREASIARMAEAMREFTSEAVLFRGPAARSGGLNGTDLQRGAAATGVETRWSAYLATLTDEQIDFAIELLGRVADIDGAEIDHLRAVTPPRRNAHRDLASPLATPASGGQRVNWR